MSVIARSMLILDMLAEAPSPVSLTDLSAATKLPLTTVHRLCTELLAEEVIERGEGGGLQIGSRLWDFGRRYVRAERLRSAASRYLHDLYEVTRVTVELAQVMGDDVAVIERIAAPEATLFDWRGAIVRVPLDASAAGVAVLAAGMRRSAEPRPNAPARWSAAIAGALREARSTGVARLPIAGAQGGIALSAAITGASGTEGAVTVFAGGEKEARAYTPSLLVTARRISAALVS